jgi:hypothetical protein
MPKPEPPGEVGRGSVSDRYAVYVTVARSGSTVNTSTWNSRWLHGRSDAGVGRPYLPGSGRRRCPVSWPGVLIFRKLWERTPWSAEIIAPSGVSIHLQVPPVAALRVPLRAPRASFTGHDSSAARDRKWVANGSVGYRGPAALALCLTLSDVCTGGRAGAAIAN